MRPPMRFSGPSTRLYLAFLVAAAMPMAITGLVGIHYSIQPLRDETLSHLDQEVASRADAIGHFMDQLARAQRSGRASLAGSPVPAGAGFRGIRHRLSLHLPIALSRRLRA